MQNNYIKPTSINLGKVISDGFVIFGKSPLLFIGSTFIFFLIMMAMFFIPGIGPFVWLIVIQPIMVTGYFIISDKVQHIDDPGLSDLFGGFKKNTGNLILNGLLAGFLSLIPISIYFVATFGMIGSSMLSDFATVDSMLTQFMGPADSMFWASYIATMSILYLIMLTYQLGLMFIYFKGHSTWDGFGAGMKLIGRNFFQTLALLIFFWIINLLGSILIGLGLLVTIPVTLATMYCVFNSTIGSREEKDEDEEIMEHLISDEL